MRGERLNTKISNEGGGEAWGGHGEGDELPEEQHEEQAPYIPLELHQGEQSSRQPGSDQLQKGEAIIRRRTKREMEQMKWMEGGVLTRERRTGWWTACNKLTVAGS